MVEVFKDGEASRKAWLKRARAVSFGGKDTGWVGEDGKPIGKDVQAALKRLKGPLPPAWKDVMVSTDPDSKLVATGVDAAGRTQRMYSTEHAGAASAEKFARVAALHGHMATVFDKSGKDMMNKKLDASARDTAATVNLVAKTGFRPGSNKDTGAEVQAYGATTLEKRHVKVNGDKITFSFVGKKGVDIKKTLEDADLSAYLSQKLPSLGNKDTIFNASGQAAGDYLKKITGGDFKVKDLRTWNGTALARELLKEYEAPTSVEQDKALKKIISTAVSEHLGNTPIMALNSYIDPAVWPSMGNPKKIKRK